MLNLFNLKKKTTEASYKSKREYEREKERLSWSELYLEENKKDEDNLDKEEK